MAPTRTYTQSRVLLELDGDIMCAPRTVEGGEPFGIVEASPAGTPAGKHVAEWRYAPIVLTFGISADPRLFGWINDWLSGKAEPRSGAILTADFDYKNTHRLEFIDAQIGGVDFGTFDGSSKDPLDVTLTIQPARTQRTKGPFPVQGNGKGKARAEAFASNFRLHLDDLPTTRAYRVSPPAATLVMPPAIAGVSTHIDAQAAAPTLSNLSVTVTAGDLDAYHSLVDSAIAGGSAQQTRSGTLEILRPDMKTVLLTITMEGLGIVRAASQHFESGSDRGARGSAEFYCEKLGVAPPKRAEEPAVPAPPAAVVNPPANVVTDPATPPNRQPGFYRDPGT